MNVNKVNPFWNSQEGPIKDEYKCHINRDVVLNIKIYKILLFSVYNK